MLVSKCVAGFGITGIPFSDTTYAFEFSAQDSNINFIFTNLTILNVMTPIILVEYSLPTKAYLSRDRRIMESIFPNSWF